MFRSATIIGELVLGLS